MNITREKIAGIIGTVLFAVLLLLALLFSYFTMTLPPQQLEGIPVMFVQQQAFGLWNLNERNNPTPSTPLLPEVTPDQSLITQTTEPTIDVEAQRQEEQEQACLAEERRQQQLAEQRRRRRGS